MQRDKLSVITLNAAKKYTDSHGGGGGGGTTNYNDLSHKPSINSTTLEGNLTLANLGIADASTVEGIFDGTDIDSFGDVESALSNKVDKVSGKSLSDNNYSDADKTIVDGVTTALSGKADASTVNAILDGSTIDSFADVETALADKVDKVNGKGLSTEDYTTAEKTKLSGIETGADVNIIESITLNGTAVSPDANKNVALTVITKAVNDLENYYTKSNTYTKTEVDTLINAITTLNLEVVQTLPTTDISTTTIYLVPKGTAQTQNVYDEYICLDATTTPATWEKIGDTEVDLTNYVQKSSTAGLIKNDGTIDTTTTSAVSANTSAISAIKDGTTIDSFADVETALGGKASTDNVIANTQLIADTVGFSAKNKLDIENYSDVNNATVEHFGIKNTNTDSRSANLHIVPLKNGASSGGAVISNKSIPSVGKYTWELDLTGRDFDALQIGFNGDTKSYYVRVPFSEAKKYNITFNATGVDPSTIGGYVLKDIMIYDPVFLDDSFEPYRDTTAFPRDEQAVMGSVNDFEVSLAKLKSLNTSGTWSNNTYTLNNVVFTVNSDGTISATGQSSSLTYLDLDTNFDTTKYAGWYLSGLPSSGSADTHRYRICPSPSDRTVIQDFNTTNIIVDNGTGKCLSIRISSGYNPNGAVFSTMVSLAEVPYVPYAMTNRELTDKVEENNSYEMQRVLGAKNLDRTGRYDSVNHEVTYKVNSDKSVTANGTANEDSYLTGNPFTATYTGMVKLTGGYSSSYMLYPLDATDGARPYADETMTTRLPSDAYQKGGNPLAFYMIAGHQYKVSIRIKNGTQVTNQTVYPMISLLNDPDLTYAAPALSNLDLTDKKVGRDELAITGAENLNRGDKGFTFVRGSGSSGTDRTKQFALGIPFSVGQKFTVAFDITASSNFATTNGISARFWGNNGTSASEDCNFGHAIGHYEHTFTIKYAGDTTHLFYMYLDQEETAPTATVTIDNLQIDYGEHHIESYVAPVLTNKELETSAYQTTDTAETTLADSDKFPFYDASASGKRSSTWSNIKSKLKTYFDSYYTAKSTVPTGGSAGQVLMKNSSTNYDTKWGSASGIPSGGSTGQVLGKKSATDYDVEWKTVSGGGTVDSSFSFSSTNPVQNKVVTKAIYFDVGEIETCNKPNRAEFRSSANVNASVNGTPSWFKDNGHYYLIVDIDISSNAGDHFGIALGWAHATDTSDDYPAGLFVSRSSAVQVAEGSNWTILPFTPEIIAIDGYTTILIGGFDLMGLAGATAKICACFPRVPDA